MYKVTKFTIISGFTFTLAVAAPFYSTTQTTASADVIDKTGHITLGVQQVAADPFAIHRWP